MPTNKTCAIVTNNIYKSLYFDLYTTISSHLLQKLSGSHSLQSQRWQWQSSQIDFPQYVHKYAIWLYAVSFDSRTFLYTFSFNLVVWCMRLPCVITALNLPWQWVQSDCLSRFLLSVSGSRVSGTSLSCWSDLIAGIVYNNALHSDSLKFMYFI